MTHFTDIPWLVALVLAYLLTDIFALRPGGLLVVQSVFLRETRSVRTFEKTSSLSAFMQPFFMLQLFLFSGLVLFCALHSDAAEQLSRPSPAIWIQLGLLVAAPAVWVVVQGGLFRWVGFLMGEHERIIILGRIYSALHLLLAPASLLVFMACILTPIGPWWALVLLIVLFILLQIAFVSSVFKIFYEGFGSLCFFFVYLCVLEIAPLCVLYAKVIE